MHLGGEITAGAEVAFEVVAQPSRLHRTPLYCYRPLTDAFIGERMQTLSRLPSHGVAVAQLAAADGLDGYLAQRGATRVPADPRQCAEVALRALLDDVFDDQSDFELHPERLAAALVRLDEGCAPGADEIVVMAALHGLALAGSELALTRGLLLAQPDAISGVPVDLAVGGDDGPHLLAVLTIDGGDVDSAVARARAVLRDLLRSLRLFGDGRVTLGSMAYSRVGGGSWRPLILGLGGRPRGMLVVTPEQEDELRAFCSLVSRRAPHANEVAWALSRFEMGCERPSDSEALSDYLLALRALLEPEGPSSGLLAGRLAALCAEPERRAALAERVAHAVALERSIVAGNAEIAGGDALVQAIGDHLRALLRDVICGHLDADLDRVADDLLSPPQDCDDAWDEPQGDPGEGLVSANAPPAAWDDVTVAAPPPGPAWVDAHDAQGMLPF